MGNNQQKTNHSNIEKLVPHQKTQQQILIASQTKLLTNHYSWLIANQGKNNVPRLYYYNTTQNNDSCCYLGGTSTITGYFQPLKKQQIVQQLNLTELSQIQLLLDWLQGVWFLSKKYGFFHIDEGMLLLNQSKTGKIWFNKNLLQTKLQFPIIQQQQKRQSICIKNLLTHSKLFHKYFGAKEYKQFLHCICYLTQKKQQLLNLTQKIKNPTVTLQTSNNSRKKNMAPFPHTVLNKHFTLQKSPNIKRMFNTVNVIPNWKFMNSSISSVGKSPICSKVKLLHNFKQRQSMHLKHNYNHSMRENYLDSSSSEQQRGILNQQEVSIVQSVYIPKQNSSIHESGRPHILEQSSILQNIDDFRLQ